MKRRKFLSLVGITVVTSFSLANGKPAKRCEDCKFYLPDLEVDGYDVITNEGERSLIICKHGSCPEDWSDCPHRKRIQGAGCKWLLQIRRRTFKPKDLTWPPKNPCEKNKTKEHNFADAKKGDYCFLIGGGCKKIPCEHFLDKKAPEKEAEKSIEKIYKLLNTPSEKIPRFVNKKRIKDNGVLLSNESVFTSDLRYPPNYRLTWLGKLLGRLQIK